MGYLDKTTVTVDAILTRRGRELLAQGRDNFAITKFAVADDEVDYGLYDPLHPLGTQYYGNTIEKMPITEATPDETQNLKYKLVSFTAGNGKVNTIPKISGIGGADVNGITLDGENDEITLTPATTPSEYNANGYTLIVFNRDALNVVPAGTNSGTSTATSTIASTSLVATGQSFRLISKKVSVRTETQVTIIGNETGATVTVPVIITPPTT